MQARQLLAPAAEVVANQLAEGLQELLPLQPVDHILAAGQAVDHPFQPIEHLQRGGQFLNRLVFQPG